MPHWDWTINVPALGAVLGLLIGILRHARAVDRRTMRIDLVLFGDDAIRIPGLVKDVASLKTDNTIILNDLRRLGFDRRVAEERRHDVSS